MSGPPASIETLIEMMARLPGFGPRSARRAVLHLVQRRGQDLAPLARAMADVADTVRDCVTCGNLATDEECDICRDPNRDGQTLCVVETVADLWAMERTRAFRGRYHVLGGTLSALDEVGPDDLGLPRLARRIEDDAVTEVILALNATLDGQTTTHYVADMLAGQTTVTSLAQGVPVGGELDYLDDGTIGAALRARKTP